MATRSVPRTEPRDYYAVLGAEPSASDDELRTAFRTAVLRHHPDRAPSSEVATRRTSVLNRAWAELRDPLRRLHYDRDLERGTAATLDWPLDLGEAPRPSRPGRRVVRAPQPSPWHQPQWRSVHGFRVPAEIWMAGPAQQDRWIVEHHIEGEDWRRHDERYWLRYAARHYRERGRVDDWLGTIERLIELEPSFEAIVRDDPAQAYLAAGQELRGAMALHAIGRRAGASPAQARWADRQVRALLGAFRDAHVRRGSVAERAEHAELLLNFLETLDLEPTFVDVRAAIVAHRRAGHHGRAAELLERVLAQPVGDANRWFSVVQLLTEAGQLDRASALLAAIARGDHPEALDPRQVSGQPLRRIGAARRRLALARRRAEAGRRTRAAADV